MNLNLDTGIFLGFLALNLAVGLYYGRGVRTVGDYALGGRNFSTGALVATLVATAASGSGFFIALSKTYSDGLYYVIASLGMALSYYLIGVLLVPRMGEFLGKNSVAEALGGIYGNKVRTITAISGTIGAAGLIAVQFKAFGTIFNYFLGFSDVFSIVLAGSIVTLYSAFGGVRSVTFTDVLQFITFGVAIPLVGLLIWSQLYATEGFSIISAFEHPKFNYKVVFDLGNPDFWQIIPLALYFTVPSMAPAFCQRIFMGSSVAQVKKAFIITAILFTALRLSIEWIPFLIFNVNPDLEANQLLSYVVDHYTYPGLKGLIIISITALAMSTADSYINSSSVLFSNDICKPLNLGASKALLISRMFSCILGVGGIVLALYAKDLLDMVLLANSFYMPVVTVPFIMAICGFRSTAKSVIIGMAAGLITVLVWKYLGIKADGIVFAMIINLIFLLGSHYILNQEGGWVGIKDTSYLDSERRLKQRDHARFIVSIRSFNLMKFLAKHSPSSELTYTGFGIYCILYTFTTMYSTQTELLREHGRVILTLYQVMMVTGVVMALYPIWPAKIKNEIIIQSWWNIAIFYMLALFNTFFVLISEFSSLQFMVFTVNTIITLILVGWRFGAIMMSLGSYLGLELYELYTGSDIIVMNIDSSPQAIILYALLLLSSVVVIFLKPNQEAHELAEEKSEHLTGRIKALDHELQHALSLKSEFIRNVNHEYHAPMTGLISMAQTLSESYDKLPDELRRQAAHTIFASAIKLTQFDNNIANLARLSIANINLKIESVDLGDLIEERVETCSKLYIANIKTQEIITEIDENVVVSCDKYYITQVIDNLIINSLEYCKEGKITIALNKNKDQVIFTVSDEGIGIPIDEIYDIFEAFTVSSKTRTPAGGRGVGLAIAKKVIDLHHGKIWAESNGHQGSIFKVVLSK